MKLNKKRTVSTIIGIILSCSLICAVATMCTSFQETLIQNAINESGYYHLKISRITEENLKDLENDKNIKDVYTINEIGYAKLENSQNKSKPYLKVYSMDESLFNSLKFNLIEGRFPVNSNELIISKHIINNAKVDYKIGDKISINIGKRVTIENEELYPNNSYNSEDEKLINKQSKEFTIVRNYRKTKL